MKEEGKVTEVTEEDSFKNHSVHHPNLLNTTPEMHDVLSVGYLN